MQTATAHTTLSNPAAADDLEWHLGTDGGREQVVRVVPRFGCEDMAAVRDAAVAGLGVAILPDQVCREALNDGRLVRVLPS